ncbi:MAG: nucleotide sugar dehydrogenase [Pseudomonadota bacterium]|nr:nucleotide sugar dehydrogenase [Pseudomonadota bacterium]
MSTDLVAIVGLGYVGLPLALAFGVKRNTLGFDVSKEKVDSYRRRVDPAGEVSPAEFAAAAKLRMSTNAEDLAEADVIIIAVPTPVDDARQPDFTPLLHACRSIGPHLKAGATVVFESTVYPGATEEICIPELERVSGKRWKADFFVGYSPERINPGDKEHTLTKITKVVSGDTPETLERLAQLYGSVIGAGVYRAESIKVAETAKVLENTQRDLNIALMNELAIICHRVGIDTTDVLRAAGTKWNFLNFRPGLVGGHCIGVDPYYLTHKAEMLGLHPQVILAGRRINDNMGKFVAEQTVKCIVSSGSAVGGASAVVLGLAFKENCGDPRNSKVVDVIRELESFGVQVFVHDPRVRPEDARKEYGIELLEWDALPKGDAVVLAVAHHEYLSMPLKELLVKVKPAGCVIDVKSALDRATLQALGLRVWRL